MSSRTFLLAHLLYHLLSHLLVHSECLGLLVNFDEIKNGMAMEIAALRYMLSKYSRNREDTVLIDP
jgi:hypothetical protein